VGAHLLAAGYDDDIDKVRGRAIPSLTPVSSPRADWTAVRVHRTLGLVGVPAGVRLDLGATAKAWTSDEAAARLFAALDLPVLVAIGGDVAVAGSGPAWPVLVSEHEGGPGQVVSIVRGGLATSSTQGRRWTTAQGDRHHLIDPRTGVPTTGPFRTVSVVAESCLAANTLATAALVWGDDAPRRLADHPVRLVHTDGSIVTTGTWMSEVVAA
jgi:thiamine biosynthesis lipoprotein